MTEHPIKSSMPPDATATWLVIGHGSVGSMLVRKLLVGGERSIFVFDPAPRVPVIDAKHILDPAEVDGIANYVMSCVPAEVASTVPALVRPAIDQDTVLFDWNSMSPIAKQEIGRLAGCSVIDIALLDSVDGNFECPRVAISGEQTSEASEMLTSLGFHVDIAGTRLGDAALLKYARSVFMKSLESLSIEYAELAAHVDQGEIVATSLANNLGEQFMQFMHLLVTTNGVHGSRRATELAEAVALFEPLGVSLAMSSAAVSVLARGPMTPSRGMPA